jgi:hypothetical protein
MKLEINVPSRFSIGGYPMILGKKPSEQKDFGSEFFFVRVRMVNSM